jgi:hypothetical protein
MDKRPWYVPLIQGTLVLLLLMFWVGFVAWLVNNYCG